MVHEETAEQDAFFLDGFASRLRKLGSEAEPPLGGYNDLASACEVALSTAHGWMNGTALPRTKYLPLIAERVGLPVSALFFFEEAGADKDTTALIDFLFRLPPERRGKVADALLRFASVLAAF